MKIIKRDGRAVDYDREKICIAIEKANKEVMEEERANKQEIKEIVGYIEKLNKKRMLVEDIQDIIEERLMKLQKYELAKRYIVYRYTRALVRKQNTTDETILGLIRNENKELTGENSNKNTMLASTQRDYIAGEVSRDLTKRMLLPEKISKAHEEGILYFHDADYFIQAIFNSCLIDIGNMLDNGTVINGKMIESPKCFQVACIIMTQIMASVASNQYGGISVDMIHLGKYLKKSYNNFKEEIEKYYKYTLSEEIIEQLVQIRLKDELKAGIQTIEYQVNTLMTAKGEPPCVTLFLHLEKDDTYIKENAMIIEELINQRCKGIKNEDGEYTSLEFPRLIYVLDEFNNLSGGEYDYLTKLAIKCSSERKYPCYISAKKMRENYKGNVYSPMGCKDFLFPWKDEEGKYKFEGRFNQGVVSLNLPQIAIISDGDENEFWKLLEERLELCKEALMCRHYALVGTKSDISPIHWQYGAITRLKKGEKIDKYLYGGYSTICLGYIGIYEMTKLMTGESHTSPKGREFALRVMKKLKETTDKWKKETNIGFMLYGTSSENLCNKFAKIDKERFGIIKDVTDKEYYTNSHYVDNREKIDMFKKLEIESEFQNISSGGEVSKIQISNMNNNIKTMETLVKFIYNNIQYVELI